MAIQLALPKRRSSAGRLRRIYGAHESYASQTLGRLDCHVGLRPPRNDVFHGFAVHTLLRANDGDVWGKGGGGSVRQPVGGRGF